MVVSRQAHDERCQVNQHEHEPERLQEAQGESAQLHLSSVGFRRGQVHVHLTVPFSLFGKTSVPACECNGTGYASILPYPRPGVAYRRNENVTRAFAWVYPEKYVEAF